LLPARLSLLPRSIENGTPEPAGSVDGSERRRGTVAVDLVARNQARMSVSVAAKPRMGSKVSTGTHDHLNSD
jgi:hypothetical protein